MKPELKKVTKELLWKIIQLDEETKEDLKAVINDCFLEYGVQRGQLNREEIKTIYDSLPFEIILDGLKNGFSDTVVRESIYEFIQNR